MTDYIDRAHAVEHMYFALRAQAKQLTESVPPEILASVAIHLAIHFVNNLKTDEQRLCVAFDMADIEYLLEKFSDWYPKYYGLSEELRMGGPASRTLAPFSRDLLPELTS